jgi:thiamine-monophosphate kinase
MGQMQVSEVGEFALIQRLAGILGQAPPPELVVGIGDDAAVWRAGAAYLVATTDTLVEGVHFLPAALPWADLGWKALAVNVSDIAAMGARPLFALVTLALPPGTPVAGVDALYGGLSDCAARFGVAIVGGDIVRAPQVSLTVALLGQAETRRGRPLLLLRSGARPGDVIAVTGSLGDAAAGLRLLRQGVPPGDPRTVAQLRPDPPLGVAQQAARLGIACGIDVSDGLLQDVAHICRMSGLSALLRAAAVPVGQTARQEFPAEALALASTGGEDYQMVFAGPRALIRRLRSLSGAVLTEIGEMREGPPEVRLLDEAGAEVRFASAGWDHLRP